MLRKELKTYKLHYAKLQTFLDEFETILNNRRITCYYDDKTETCLTPSHLFYGIMLALSKPQLLSLSYPNQSFSVHPEKLTTVRTHLWNRWQNKYLTNLHESNEIHKKRRNTPLINANDIVVIGKSKFITFKLEVG